MLKIIVAPWRWIHKRWSQQRFDNILLLCLLGILGISLATQYSIGVDGLFQRHAVFIALGLLIFFLAYLLPTDLVREGSYVFYGLTVALLLLVLINGRTANGAQSWLAIGSFSMQPAEPAKLACILLLAKWFSEHKPHSLWQIIVAGVLVVLLPFGLIFLQPDLGTAMVLIAIFISMAFWAKAKITDLAILFSPMILLVLGAIDVPSLGLIHLNLPLELELLGRKIQANSSSLAVLYIACLGLWLFYRHRGQKILHWLFITLYLLFCLSVSFFVRPVAWSVLKPYQQKRLTVFLDPYSDSQSAGYNIIQSLLAVGSGRLTGQGYGQGYLTQGDFVPEQHTDFVFSAVAEEWGFIGAGGLVLLFYLLCMRIWQLITGLENKFQCYVAAGILTMITFHILVNIGMNIGLLPITGVPLPFLSYGGTSLWVCLFSLGLLQRMHSQGQRHYAFFGK